MERPTVLLALTEDSADYVSALERAGFDTIHDPAKADEQLRNGRTLDLAVLDCDADRAAVDAVYAILHQERSVPTLLLFTEEPPEFEAHAGAADELALKPLPAEALIYRLQALLIRGGRQVHGEVGAWTDASGNEQGAIGEGHVVSVFAPKGGVGKTTIAVNSAVALREQTRDRVLLLDADVGVGNVTSVLEVPATMGLVDLADSTPAEWTDAAFEHCIATHPASGLRVLTWGNDPGDSERISVDLLLAAVKWARRSHAYVVVDNHPGYDDRTMAMLTVSNEILLVVTPEVGAIRNSSQFLDLARQVGLGGIVRVVANRANHGISLQDMSQSLGLPISATVVSAGPKAVIAANEGTPIITKFPKERIATDLHGVARLLTRRQEATAPAATRRWWMPFTSRASHA
jgi:ATPases involved in chromosome partitioning